MNEDSVLVGRQIVAVADGMGGHAAGDVASSIAVETLGRLDHDELTPESLVAAVLAASARIADTAAADPTRWGMGTTIAGLGVVSVAGSTHWAIFNVGDSRVYHARAGELVRATTDHSEVEELVLAGRITPEEARVHPDRNIITRSLGTDPAPQVDIRLIPPADRERFLVCSDGLVSEVTDEEIAALLAQHEGAQRAADELMTLALQRGARDNVSVVVVNAASDSTADADQGPAVTTQPRGSLGGGLV